MSKFLGYLAENQDQKELTEAFNTEAYELTFGKKNAGDIYFTFIDEDGKEFRIQFYTPAGLGKNVRQVFIGQKKGSIYPDVITKFKNPMKVIASMIEATKQYLVTPIGRGIDGFAINFSKRALDRGLQLVPKIIRQSGLKQKLNVMDLTYSPDPSRGYVWVIRKGKDPAEVFNGPKMAGITWDDPDRVGDGNTADASNAGNPLAQTDNSDTVTDTKWDALVAAMKKSYVGNSVKVVGWTAVGQVMKDGIKVIVGLIRNSEMVAMNLDAYDKSGTQVSLPISTRSFPEIDVNKPDALTKVMNLAIDVVVEISSREAVVTGGTGVGQWKYSGRTGIDSQPQMVYSITKGVRTYSALVAPHADQPDVFVLNGSDHKNFRGPTAAGVINQARLPEPPTDMYNQFYRDSKTFWETTLQFDFTKLRIPATGKVTNGNPNGITVTWGLATSTTISQDKGVIKFVTTPDGKPAFNMEIPSGDLKNIQWYLDGIPGMLAKMGAGAPAGPNLANLQDKMPSGATLNVIPGIPSEVTIDWSVALPKTAVKTEEISFRTGIRVDSRYAYITNYVLRNGQIINNPKSYNISIQGLNALSVLGNWLETQSALLQRYRWVISQFADTNYNPSGSLPAITWKNDGEMYIDGQSAKRLSSSEILGMMKQAGLSDVEWQAFAKASAKSDAAKKNTYTKDKITAWYSRGQAYIISNITRGLEGVDLFFEAYSSNNSRETLPITIAKEVGIMTPLDLKNILNQRVPEIFDMIGEPDPVSNPGSMAVFANQIRDSAPETRDVEWYVGLHQQGALLDVHWSLTFRRNTRAGAVREYQSQVNTANAYVQAVVNLAKAKGFNVQDPRIMTAATADEWDRNSAQNGDDAYSEYEQSIGGGVNILVK